MEAAKEIQLYPQKKGIPGGYYIMARKIDESEIAHAAPCIREVWEWLIRQCNHKDNPGLGIKRGQCVRRIADIQEGLHWYVGFRKMIYTKTQCEGALEHLRKKLMITTTKTTRGMVITICKYDFYQDSENYEGNNEGNKKTTRRQQAPDTINKNVNKGKDSTPPEGWKFSNNGFFDRQLANNQDKTGIDEYRELVEFLHGKNRNSLVFENVLSLEKQISFKDFLQLRETAKSSPRTIGEVLSSMENKKTLKKEYNNVFLTANNWLKNDFSKK